MGMAALAEPLAIKISSKRQITIPARAYEEAGFKDYALCTWTDKGLFLQPLDVENEDVTVDILRYLIEEGYEGEDLIAQYQALKTKVVSVKDKLDEAERDIAEGRVDSYENMRARIRDKYGI
ncbi:delta-aminolevulinic acid dehydratase [Eggerthella sinensis]|uniref:delta-aminolevulinic acid dehydratase n=1 Tax=Eggerthella sinensis TaxID=242230 RepID=UPI0022E925D7|nr:delta-aminolevulinic acid dehydratase [Eggerthella sinensis]